MSVVLKLSDIWSVSLKMIGLWPPPHNKTVSGKRLEKLRFPGFSAGQIFEFSSGLKPGSQSHLVWSEVEPCLCFTASTFLQFISDFFQIYFPFPSNSLLFQLQNIGFWLRCNCLLNNKYISVALNLSGTVSIVLKRRKANKTQKFEFEFNYKYWLKFRI